MQTLTAIQETETEGLYKGFRKTILKNEKGDIVAIYPPNLRQPNRNGKTIVHNCQRYNVIWVNEQVKMQSVSNPQT